jgi:hypothetical protein
MKKRTLWRSRWKRWQRFPANEKILIGSYLFGYFICWVKINYKIISSCIGSAPDFGVNFPGVRFRLLVFVLSHFVFFLFFILIQGKKFSRWGGRWKKGPGNILQCSVALFFISVIDVIMDVIIMSSLCILQGILKGEVSLYCWPPVWLVWNQLYDNLPFLLFLLAKQTNPNRICDEHCNIYTLPFRSAPCDNDGYSSLTLAHLP